MQCFVDGKDFVCNGYNICAPCFVNLGIIIIDVSFERSEDDNTSRTQ